jgi:hypothetical protein
MVKIRGENSSFGTSVNTLTGPFVSASPRLPRYFAPLLLVDFRSSECLADSADVG